MLYFVPVDSTKLNLNLPVGSNIDRFAVAGLVFAWFWFGGDERAFLRTRRSKLFPAAACLFLIVAVASLLLGIHRTVNLGELSLAEKRFGLLGSFLILGWFTLSALRFEDVRGFSSFVICLASLVAIGMLVERRTGYNVFYSLSRSVLKPIASVAPAPTDIHPAFGTDGRPVIVGPTLHGLAATTLLVVPMPFAIVRILDATSRKTWWLNVLALTLMISGAMATSKRTALVVPLAVVLSDGPPPAADAAVHPDRSGLPRGHHPRGFAGVARRNIEPQHDDAIDVAQGGRSRSADAGYLDSPSDRARLRHAQS